MASAFTSREVFGTVVFARWVRFTQIRTVGNFEQTYFSATSTSRRREKSLNAKHLCRCKALSMANNQLFQIEVYVLLLVLQETPSQESKKYYDDSK